MKDNKLKLSLDVYTLKEKLIKCVQLIRDSAPETLIDDYINIYFRSTSRKTVELTLTTNGFYLLKDKYGEPYDYHEFIFEYDAGRLTEIADTRPNQNETIAFTGKRLEEGFTPSVFFKNAIDYLEQSKELAELTYDTLEELQINTSSDCTVTITDSQHGVRCFHITGESINEERQQTEEEMAKMEEYNKQSLEEEERLMKELYEEKGKR